MVEFKQVILVNTSLKMSKGKTAAQVAHASLKAFLESARKDAEPWLDEGMKKVVLKVADVSELVKYKKKAKAKGLIAEMIKDAGMTELPPGSITCVGIGPAQESEIDAVTGELKMM